jgi:hypothetical protein
MPIMAIYWKGVWERSFRQNGTFIFGHTAAEQACFDRRMAMLRARVSLFAA